MANVEISYKGNTIASMNASGSKTLKTAGKYCEGDIGVEYSAPTPTLISKSISANGTYNATAYNADGFSAVTVNVPTGSESSRSWILQLSADSASGAALTITTSDWLKAHRGDSGLVITICPLQAISSGATRLVGLIHANQKINGNYYGVLVRYNSSGSATSVYTESYSLSASTSIPVGFKIETDGTLKLGCRDTSAAFIIAAGSYIITASVPDETNVISAVQSFNVPAELSVMDAEVM